MAGFDATFWALIGLVLFVLIIAFMGVPGQVLRGLDGRADRIRKELDDARRLREEAQALLASYQRRQRDAEAEAQEIVARARSEARRFAEEAREQLSQQVERRTKLAEAKIVQAEREALREVREVAASLAVGAAERLIAERFTPSDDAILIERDIAALKSRLH